MHFSYSAVLLMFCLNYFSLSAWFPVPGGLSVVAVYISLLVLGVPAIFVQLKLGGYLQTSMVSMFTKFFPIWKGWSLPSHPTHTPIHTLSLRPGLPCSSSSSLPGKVGLCCLILHTHTRTCLKTRPFMFSKFFLIWNGWSLSFSHPTHTLTHLYTHCF